MERVHEVKQGECLSSIAARYRLRSWRQIYDHPKNEELRKLRPNPNLIYPGDKVVIPEPVKKTVSLTTGETHKLIVVREKVRLKLVLWRDRGGEKVAGAFQLEIEGFTDPIKGELQDGTLDVEVPPGAMSGRLTLFKEDGETVAHCLDLAIGALDPIDTISGLQSRLKRLGYDPGPVDGIWGPRTASSVAAFQRAEQLSDDESPYGTVTQDALVNILGN